MQFSAMRNGVEVLQSVCASTGVTVEAKGNGAVPVVGGVCVKRPSAG